MIRYLTPTALLLAALLVAPSTHAEVTHQDGVGTYSGKGRLEASGFGSARIHGCARLRAEGIGTVQAPAGVKFRSNQNRLLWRETDGSPIEGLGWIEMKFMDREESEAVRIDGCATLRVKSRWGKTATVVLEGSGTVRHTGMQQQ